MKEKLLDLWISQLNVDKIKEKLNEEEKKMQDIVESMTNEELIVFVEYFNKHHDIDDVVPDCLVYALHELEDREEKEMEDEEVPF